MLNANFAIENLLLWLQKDTFRIVEIWFIAQSLLLIFDINLKSKNKDERKRKNEKRRDEKCEKQEEVLSLVNWVSK